MRQARYTAGGGLPVELSSPSALVGTSAVDEIPAQTTTTTMTRHAITLLKPTRDFFGRIITSQHQQDGVVIKTNQEGETKLETERGGMNKKGKGANNHVWVSFNEGFSNAVRKPITIEELMKGF